MIFLILIWYFLLFWDLKIFGSAFIMYAEFVFWNVTLILSDFPQTYGMRVFIFPKQVIFTEWDFQFGFLVLFCWNIYSVINPWKLASYVEQCLKKVTYFCLFWNLRQTPVKLINRNVKGFVRNQNYSVHRTVQQSRFFNYVWSIFAYFQDLIETNILNILSLFIIEI